jgi:carboxymethylenebutenolidase
MPKTAEVTTQDGPMLLYDAEPEAGPRAAVVVLQEAFGVTDHIEDVTHRFAAAGYRAVAPHLFHRSGDPALAYDDVSKVRPHTQALTQFGLLDDVDATFSYLADAGFRVDQVGIVGFCMGGSVAFYMAVRYGLGASVSFYGGGIASGRYGFPPMVEVAPELQAPWLGLYGDQDEGIPIEEVESLRRPISKAPVPAELVRYPDAGHGFNCDVRPSYHGPSAQDGWRRTLEWFAEHL